MSESALAKAASPAAPVARMSPLKAEPEAPIVTFPAPVLLASMALPF